MSENPEDNPIWGDIMRNDRLEKEAASAANAGKNASNENTGDDLPDPWDFSKASSEDQDTLAKKMAHVEAKYGKKAETPQSIIGENRTKGNEFFDIMVAAQEENEKNNPPEKKTINGFAEGEKDKDFDPWNFSEEDKKKISGFDRDNPEK